MQDPLDLGAGTSSSGRQLPGQMTRQHHGLLKLPRRETSSYDEISEGLKCKPLPFFIQSSDLLRFCTKIMGNCLAIREYRAITTAIAAPTMQRRRAIYHTVELAIFVIFYYIVPMNRYFFLLLLSIQ